MDNKIIVIHGFFSNGPNGLMNTARSCYAALKDNYEVKKSNISYPGLIKLKKIIPTTDFDFFDKNNFYIHIFCIQPQHSRVLIRKILKKNLKKNNHFIGFWPWELSKWPDIWHKDLQLIDELWCLSKFIYNSIPPVNFPLKKFVISPGFRLKKEIKNGNHNKVSKFIFSYDPRSKYKRKNPKGVLFAFWNAFGFPFDKNLDIYNKNVKLTIKLINTPAISNGIERFKKLINLDKRITIIKENLVYKDLIELYKNHDCYISLHKSEGFGNAIAENLIIGNEVITTYYSGEKDFCSEDNAHLIDFHFENVGNDYPHSSNSDIWAVPNIKMAAEKMQNLANGTERKNISGPTIDFSIISFKKRIIKRIDSINCL